MSSEFAANEGPPEMVVGTLRFGTEKLAATDSTAAL
jgi:hypothetical protein